MTPDERRLAELELEALRRQTGTAASRSGDFSAPEQTASAEAKKEPEPIAGLDKSRGALQTNLRGALFGWGDEIVARNRSLVDQYLPNQMYDFGGGVNMDKQSTPDRYQMYLEDTRGVENQYARDNPEKYTGKLLTSALASPLSRVGPGAAATTLKQSAARAAAEGALAGAGESTGGAADTAGEAGLGATISAGLSTALGGAMRGGAYAFNVAKPLFEDVVDAAGNVTQRFKPVHLVDEEGLLGDMYRGFIGRVYGARTKLRHQEAPFVEATQQAENLARGQVDDAKSALAQTKKNIEETRRVTKEQAADRLTDVKDSVEIERLTNEAATAQALADDVTNLRAIAAQEAVPDDNRIEVLQGVDLDEPQAVSKVLHKFWTKDAFQMVKQRQFSWEPQLVDDLRLRFSNDPELMVALGEAPEIVEGLARRFGLSDDLLAAFKSGRATDQQVMALIDGMVPPGTLKIDGDALMTMRNVFARTANKSRDNAFAYRQVANQFDDLIARQLNAVDPGLAEAYRDQLARWTHYQAYREATRKAAKEGGKWSAEQFMTVAAKYGDPSLERAPVQAETQGVLARARDAAARQNEAKLYDKDIVRDATRANAAARRAADEEARNATTTATLDRRLPRAEQALADATAARRAQDALRVPENSVSGLSSALTTGTLGAPIAGAVGLGFLPGLAATIPAGIAVGEALATPGAQRMLAGQTAVQKGLQHAIETGKVDEYIRLMGRLLAQGGTAGVENMTNGP